MQIVLAVLGSGAFFTFVQFLINRYDSKREELKTIQSEIILIRANDEILSTAKHHTKEWFDQLLDDIDNYDRYCQAHPDYRNSVAVSAMNNLKRIYTNCLENNSFLKE